MKVTRRAVSAGVLATGLMPLCAVNAQRRFPGDQPVKVIVGFPPGGAQDNVARVVADRLSAYWGGASVVVENIPGAGSNLGFDRVAKGPADGTQLLVVPPGLAINQFLYSKLPFDPDKDFIPIGLVVTIPNLIYVRNSLPVASMAELIAYAKANPGKLNCTSTGIGTTPHLAFEMLKRMAGIEFTIVQYRGSAPALNDLLAGAVDVGVDNTTSVAPHAKAGSVRPLGITSLKRWPLAEDYVPVSDTVPGYEVLGFSGIAVRAGTPKDICDSIEAAVAAVCGEPAFKARMAEMLAVVGGTGAAAFGDFLAAERAKWGKLITDLGIKAGN